MTKHFVTDEDITELIERLKPPISEYGLATVSSSTLLDAGELLERYLKDRESWRKTLVMEREVLLHATRLKDQYKRERDDARQQIESLLPFRMQEPKGVPT